MDEVVYLKRTLESYFKKANQQFPVLLVTGARQVGKSTFLQSMNKGKRPYITLDDPRIKALAKEDPALFMQRFTAPLIIDEIQYAPEIIPFIKMAVDKNRKNGMFWLTGSQQFHLMKGVSESLAGRVAVLQLLGLSEEESHGRGYDLDPFVPNHNEIKKKLAKNQLLSLKDVYQKIWRGSFPYLITNKKSDPALFYQAYVQTYLQRDILNFAKVGDELTFFRFLRALAARSGQLLNMTDISRDIGVSPNTAKHWVSILQASGIIYLLEPYHTNITKRLIKTPKLYFLDTGLCAWLTEWSNANTLEAGAMSGAIFETWVISEILKSWLHRGVRPPCYFYRDKDQKEIDLLIVKDNVIYPLEIKKTASPQRATIQHFHLLEKTKLSLGHGGIICLAEEYIPITNNLSIIPVQAIC